MLTLVFAVACKTTSLTPSGSNEPAVRISPDVKILVVVPPDGTYSNKSYDGSGSMVGASFERALLTHASKVTVASASPDLDAVIVKARQSDCAYALLPRITQWEDRATEWSGKRDKMELVVRVVDVRTGAVVRTATISGRSSWFTFGGDHPQDLLDSPVKEFVKSLFL
jgi:hypothetical protein